MRLLDDIFTGPARPGSVSGLKWSTRIQARGEVQHVRWTKSRGPAIVDPNGHGPMCTLGPDCTDPTLNQRGPNGKPSIAAQNAAAHAPGAGMPAVAAIPSCPTGFDVQRRSLHGKTTCDILSQGASDYAYCETLTGQAQHSCLSHVQSVLALALKYDAWDCFSEGDDGHPYDAFCEAERQRAAESGPSAGQIAFRGFVLACTQVCIGPIAGRGLSYIARLFASKLPTIAGEGGEAAVLVIGKNGALDSYELRANEFRLVWDPSKGSAEADWSFNELLIRDEAANSTRIRDISTSLDQAGQYGLRDNTGFLARERKLLGDLGYNFKSDTGYWEPPH